MSPQSVQNQRDLTHFIANEENKGIIRMNIRDFFFPRFHLF